MQIIKKNELDSKFSYEFYKTLEYENISDIDDIINNVKKYGDKYLIKLSKKFNDGDFNSAADFVVSKDEIKKAYGKVSSDFIDNIKIAKENIELFAKKQLDCISNLNIKIDKSTLGHKIVPLNKVLCYVPGGNYPLPSSALMTVIPAKVAGVKEVLLTSPRIKPETIVAADIAGADKIYKLGGAQAVSAFAYGTETLPMTDKIVGPGNRYVTYAKKAVYGKVDIDFLAGPSEVLIIADDSADAKLIAADMLAQSEHDKDARSYLLTTSKKLAQEVQSCADEYLKNLETSNIAKAAFDKSFAVICDDVNDMADISNKRAPEHLEVMLENNNAILSKLTNYGSLFIGKSCAEVFGDYVSGTNHVLPTNSAARYTGGLSVFDFIKILTYQNIAPEYAKILSETASYIANSEGLMAHKLASELRG